MAPHTKAPVVVEGFTLLQTKYSADSKPGHHLYVKEHNVRESHVSKPPGRTLFVANVPPYVTQESLKQVFTQYGKVQHVYFHQKPNSGPPIKKDTSLFKNTPEIKGFKFAYVVFENAKSVKKVKDTPFDDVKVLNHPSILLGVSRLKAEEPKPVNMEDFQAKIEAFMKKFDAKEEEEKQKAKELEGQADEDGWVTVTRTGKNKGVPRTEANQQRAIAREKKRRREKELLNFYSHQLRDSKKEDMKKIQEEFAADKRKIQMMRAQRKFKPY